MQISSALASIKNNIIGSWKVVKTDDTVHRKNIEAEFFTFLGDGFLQLKSCMIYKNEKTTNQIFRDTIYTNFRYSIHGNKITRTIDREFYKDEIKESWQQKLKEHVAIETKSNEEILYLRALDRQVDIEYIITNRQLKRVAFLDIQEPLIESFEKKINSPINYKNLMGSWIQVDDATKHYTCDYIEPQEIISFYPDSTIQIAYSKNGWVDYIYQKNNLKNFSFLLDTNGLLKNRYYGMISKFKIEANKTDVLISEISNRATSERLERTFFYFNDSIIQFINKQNGFVSTYKKSNLNLQKQKNIVSSTNTQLVKFQLINSCDTNIKNNLNTNEIVSITAHLKKDTALYDFSTLYLNGTIMGVNDSAILFDEVTYISKTDSFENFLESNTFSNNSNKTYTLNTRKFSIVITKNIREEKYGNTTFTQMTTFLGALTSLVIAPLISIKYKSPLGFNSDVYFKTEKYSLAATALSTIVLLLSQEKTKDFHVAENLNTRNKNEWILRQK
jgi:hypothetical protein